MTAAGSWKPRSSALDGRSVARPVGCFKHPVVLVLGTDLCSSAVLISPYYSPPSPMGRTPTICMANHMFRLWNKKCSETGPNRRCSMPKSTRNGSDTITTVDIPRSVNLLAQHGRHHILIHSSAFPLAFNYTCLYALSSKNIYFFIQR